MGLPVEQGLQEEGVDEPELPTTQSPQEPVPEPDASLPPPTVEDLPVVEPTVGLPTVEEPPLPNLKTCRNCGEKKPRTDFHKNHSKADELEDVCRPCKAQRDASRRAMRASVTSASHVHLNMHFPPNLVPS